MPDEKWCSIISDKCPEQNTECWDCCLYVIYHDFLDRSYEKKEQEEAYAEGN